MRRTEYLTYVEYVQLGGKLTETEFDTAARRASAELDLHTFGRLKNDNSVPTAVKCCMVELANLWASGEKVYGGDDMRVLTSVSNDGVSEHYNTASAADWYGALYRQRASEIINTYLADVRNEVGVPLLYRGCR